MHTELWKCMANPGSTTGVTGKVDIEDLVGRSATARSSWVLKGSELIFLEDVGRVGVSVAGRVSGIGSVIVQNSEHIVFVDCVDHKGSAEVNMPRG